MANGTTDSLLDKAKFFREHVQTILSLATGAFVLSVTFLHDITPKAQQVDYLRKSWAIFVHHTAWTRPQLRSFHLRGCWCKEVWKDSQHNQLSVSLFVCCRALLFTAFWDRQSLALTLNLKDPDLDFENPSVLQVYASGQQSAHVASSATVSTTL